MTHSMMKHLALLSTRMRIEKKSKEREELMRKEQQKAFQEKQKLNPEKHTDGFDITSLRDDPKDDEGISNKRNLFNDVILPAAKSDFDKSGIASQAPASIPLVPSGFANTTL